MVADIVNRLTGKPGILGYLLVRKVTRKEVNQ